MKEMVYSDISVSDTSESSHEIISISETDGEDYFYTTCIRCNDTPCALIKYRESIDSAVMKVKDEITENPDITVNLLWICALNQYIKHMNQFYLVCNANEPLERCVEAYLKERIHELLKPSDE